MGLPVPRVIWLALLVVVAIAASVFVPGLRELTRGWRQPASTKPAPIAPPPIYQGSVTLTRDSRRVVNAALAVLAETGRSVIYLDRDQGLIRTGSVSVGQAQLRGSTTPRFHPVVDAMAQGGGRYVLNITATRISPNETLVRVDPLIILTIAGSNSAVGGQILPSSMQIETEFLQQLAAKLR